MIEYALLPLFIPTFFFVSITPGLCMTLAFTLGMTIGLRRTLWMMLGELTGVGLVAAAAVVGIATLMLTVPSLFWILKIGGGIYLAWLGLQLWRSRGSLAINATGRSSVATPTRTLILQGFITAIANPKGWAFFIALLPPFIAPELPLTPQLAGWVAIILSLEFSCLLIYAAGGHNLGRLLTKPHRVRLLNRITGSLMFGVAIWLVLD